MCEFLTLQRDRLKGPTTLKRAEQQPLSEASIWDPRLDDLSQARDCRGMNYDYFFFGWPVELR